MKFYAVKRGKEGAQVYNTWALCDLNTKGFKGAKFKSFPTEQECWDWIAIEEEIMTQLPEGHHITCDGSSSIKNNFYQYQLVWSDTKELIYQSPKYQDGTNNTAEVLGLCVAIIYRVENQLDCNIYTDSQTAISACEKGFYNMKSDLISEETRKRVINALKSIENLNKRKIVHWNSSLLQIQIPSDFNRK